MNNNEQIDSTNPESNELLRDFVETAKLKAENESKSLRIQEIEIESHKEYALKALEIQRELLTQAPENSIRKTKIHLGFAFAFTLVFIVFILACLYLGKEEFIRFLIDKSVYFLLTALGYVAGFLTPRKTKDKTDKDASEATVVD